MDPRFPLGHKALVFQETPQGYRAGIRFAWKSEEMAFLQSLRDEFASGQFCKDFRGSLGSGTEFERETIQCLDRLLTAWKVGEETIVWYGDLSFFGFLMGLRVGQPEASERLRALREHPIAAVFDRIDATTTACHRDARLPEGYPNRIPQKLIQEALIP